MKGFSERARVRGGGERERGKEGGRAKKERMSEKESVCERKKNGDKYRYTHREKSSIITVT